MRCSSCGIENRKGAKFCAGCGTVLVATTCAECGTAISPAAKFCDSCGTAVATQPGKARTFRPLIGSPRAPTPKPPNRRQMSLLCCDLVDSTALARRMDPEDLRYAVTNFHRISKEIIDHYEGYYAQYMGDGFMAYFSYPVAHEDDAYRAVLTGLEIVDAIVRFNVELKQAAWLRAPAPRRRQYRPGGCRRVRRRRTAEYRGPGSGRRHPQRRRHHGDDKAAASVRRVRLRGSRRAGIEERRSAAAVSRSRSHGGA